MPGSVGLIMSIDGDGDIVVNFPNVRSWRGVVFDMEQVDPTALRTRKKTPANTQLPEEQVGLNEHLQLPQNAYDRVDIVA